MGHTKIARLTYINCYYFILAAMSRILSEGANPLLIIQEVDPTVSPQWEGLFNLLLVIHYVTASPNSAAILCTPKIVVIYLCQPSPNQSVVICIPNSFPKFPRSLLRFLFSPLVPVDTYCTLFFCLPLSLSHCAANTFFLFSLICCYSISRCCSCSYCCCCCRFCCWFIRSCSCSLCSYSCCAC